MEFWSDEFLPPRVTKKLFQQVLDTNFKDAKYKVAVKVEDEYIGMLKYTVTNTEHPKDVLYYCVCAVGMTEGIDDWGTYVNMESAYLTGYPIEKHPLRGLTFLTLVAFYQAATKKWGNPPDGYWLSIHNDVSSGYWKELTVRLSNKLGYKIDYDGGGSRFLEEVTHLKRLSGL